MAESNTPERIKVQAAATGWENVEMVDAASYDRVVAERDEAQRQARENGEALMRTRNGRDRYRELLAWIDGGFVPGAGRTTYGDPATFLDEIHRRTSAALAEGEQPAGEPKRRGKLWQAVYDAVDDPANDGKLCRIADDAVRRFAVGEQSDRESMPREAREAAIRRAVKAVRSGSGWVRRAGEQSTTETATGPMVCMALDRAFQSAAAPATPEDER